jgi:hypothetical protein
VKSFLAKRNEDDQKLLAKKAGRLRHRVREVWCKGDDEDELKEWRDKIESAANYFHVRVTYLQSTGNSDCSQVAAAVHNHDALQNIVVEMQQTRQVQTLHLEAILRAQDDAKEARRRQEESSDWGDSFLA